MSVPLNSATKKMSNSLSLNDHADWARAHNVLHALPFARVGQFPDFNHSNLLVFGTGAQIWTLTSQLWNKCHKHFPIVAAPLSALQGLAVMNQNTKPPSSAQSTCTTEVYFQQLKKLEGQLHNFKGQITRVTPLSQLQADDVSPPLPTPATFVSSKREHRQLRPDKIHSFLRSRREETLTFCEPRLLELA